MHKFLPSTHIKNSVASLRVSLRASWELGVGFSFPLPPHFSLHAKNSNRLCLALISFTIRHRSLLFEWWSTITGTLLHHYHFRDFFQVGAVLCFRDLIWDFVKSEEGERRSKGWSVTPLLLLRSRDFFPNLRKENERWESGMYVLGLSFLIVLGLI